MHSWVPRTGAQSKVWAGDGMLHVNSTWMVAMAVRAGEVTRESVQRKNAVNVRAES